MSELRNRANRLKAKSRVKPITFFAASVLLIFPTVTPMANATGPTPTAAMYLDQPFVQGSYVAEQYQTETSVTTFDDQELTWYNHTGPTCSFSGGTVDSAVYPAQDCHVYSPDIFGGASSTSSTLAVGDGANRTRYAAVGSGGISITFDTPQTYFGMWWSAGSYGNLVQLQDGSDIVASVSADDVQNTLNQTAYLTSGNNDYYASKFYLGNPYGWSTVGTPTNFTDLDADNTYQNTGNVDPNEGFVFIHFIAAPGTTFDRVNMIAPGNGFEFDNFTTSSSTDIATNIPSRLVLQRQLYAPTYVDFDSNGGAGALPRQYSSDGNAGYLSHNCINYEDPTNCILSLNDTAEFMGWSDTPDGSGNLYGWFFSYWGQTWNYGNPYPFTESKTMYAQWRNNFSYRYLTYYGEDISTQVTGDNLWDYVDYGSQQDLSVMNFGDITLPSDTRPDQYLEGWYRYSYSDGSLIRVGSPGDIIHASSYTHWDTNLFGHWVDNPPPPPPPTSVDATAPSSLPVYPRVSSVELPSMPITGDTAASVCMVESDAYGNEVSSNLQFTDLGTASSGFTSRYLITSPTPLVTNSSRYVRATISTVSDPTCSSGTTHVIEIRPIGAKLSQVVQVYLTVR